MFQTGTLKLREAPVVFTWGSHSPDQLWTLCSVSLSSVLSFVPYTSAHTTRCSGRGFYISRVNLCSELLSGGLLRVWSQFSVSESFDCVWCALTFTGSK